MAMPPEAVMDLLLSMQERAPLLREQRVAVRASNEVCGGAQKWESVHARPLEKD